MAAVSKFDHERMKEDVRHIATTYPGRSIQEIYEKISAKYVVTFPVVRGIVVCARKKGPKKELTNIVTTKPLRLTDPIPAPVAKAMNMIDMQAFQAVYAECAKHPNYLEIVQRVAELNLLVGSMDNLISWVKFISNKGEASMKGSDA